MDTLQERPAQASIQAGTPNYKKLQAEGRLPQPISPKGSVFDPNPNPTIVVNGKNVSGGYTRGADELWRVGYSPEDHYENLILAYKNGLMDRDTSFVVELHQQEAMAFAEWLKKTGKKLPGQPGFSLPEEDIALLSLKGIYLDQPEEEPKKKPGRPPKQDNVLTTETE